MIKLMKFYVTNGEKKAKVWYSHQTLRDGRECVTIYAKTCLEKLAPVFGACVENNSDMMTDYFEKDRVRIFPDSPFWGQALARANCLA